MPRQAVAAARVPVHQAIKRSEVAGNSPGHQSSIIDRFSFSALCMRHIHRCVVFLHYFFQARQFDPACPSLNSVRPDPDSGLLHSGQNKVPEFPGITACMYFLVLRQTGRKGAAVRSKLENRIDRCVICEYFRPGNSLHGGKTNILQFCCLPSIFRHFQVGIQPAANSVRFFQHSSLCDRIILQSARPQNKSRTGIQLTQQTGTGSDTGICHSGQAKRSAGISSFRSRARVWGIPVFPCGETGTTVLV